MGSFMSLFLLVETAITCMTHIIYGDFQTIVFSLIQSIIFENRKKNVTCFGCLF